MQKIVRLIMLLSILLLVLTGCIANADDKFKTTLWPNGTINYMFVGNFTEEDEETIQLAMQKWEQGTSIKFESTFDISSDTYYIISGDNSSGLSASTRGFQKHNFTIINSPVEPDLILHELGHCLGLGHEHQRSDRDSYISIQWQNITDEYLRIDFIKDESVPTEYSYDYNSVMHYDAGICGDPAFYANGLRDRQEFELSDMDLQKINDMYLNYDKKEFVREYFMKPDPDNNMNM
ncbi:MAG: hypothetical protein JW807_09605 [Spirochaetes bacterium]|nr:hypothetical protein [Spirochaetota bacterium]